MDPTTNQNVVTTKFPVLKSMPFNPTNSQNGLPTNRPIRVPQPPANVQNQNPMLLKARHCATPSTSSLNSNTTTTFPAGNGPSSTSSLPVFQSPPVGGVRRAPSHSTASTSTLPVYNTFATHTLPNRRLPQMVDMRVGPHANGSFNGSSTNSMSRADLMELAKRRQQQIEANDQFIDELQRQQHSLMLAKRNGLCVRDEADRLRDSIQRDEQTLQQLGALKRDAIQTQRDAQAQRQVLQSLQNESHAKDVELRQAANKLHSLQKQRDLMHQRRMAAANAAQMQQERLNAMQQKPSQQPNALDELYGEVRKPLRPKASVVPFQVQRQPMPTQVVTANEKRRPPPSYDEIDAARQFNRVPMRPHVQGKYSSTSIDSHQQYNNQQQDQNSPWVLRTSAVDTFILRNDSLKAAKRRSWAHVEEKQNVPIPEPSSSIQQPTSSAMFQQKPQIISSSTSQQKVQTSTKTQQAPSKPQPTTTESKKKSKNHNLLSSLFGRKKDSSSSSKQKATVAPIKDTSKTPQNIVVAKPIQESNELPKQAPLIEKTVNETKKIVEPTKINEECNVSYDVLPQIPVKEKIVEEKQKEEELPDPPTQALIEHYPSPIETTIEEKEVLPERASSDLEEPHRNQSASPPEDPKQQEERCESEASSVESHDEPKPLTNEEEKMLAATKEIMRQLNALDVDTVRVINAPKARIDSDDDLEGDDDDSDADSDKDLYRMQHDVLIQPYEHSLDEYEQEEQTTTEEASSNDGESADEPQFDEIMRPTGLRSCLKNPELKDKPKKHMKFDPWIIFLNAALEGQLDLVKDNAGRIADVSQANEEGITALHNAICAGHYEIVKYLVNEHADVNAQDSDGWTPLHCASSCNNLPIAKLLIENGACIFATSVSDSETPAQKCEEAIKATQDVIQQNYFDGCYAYLETADKCMGLPNINEGKVFTAFDYTAERDDELSFEAGDELRVLSRETGERGIMPRNPYDFMYQIQLPLSEDCLWWMCESVKTGQKGLVPRNFLTLYPLWRYVPQNFKSFELPSNPQALEALLKQNAKTNDEDKTDNSEDKAELSRRDSNATLDPCGDNASDDQNAGSCSPDSSRSSDEAREENSPPPLPKPDFDSNMQISAHA